MDEIRTFVEGSDLQQWGAAGTIAVSTFVLLWSVRWAGRRRFQGRSTRPDDLPALLSALASATWLLTLVLVATSLGLRVVAVPGGVVWRALDILTITVVLVQVARWGTVVIDYAIRRIQRDREAGTDAAASTAIGGFAFVSRVVLWAIVLVLILDNVGVEVTGVIAGLGIGGIAVALAAQRILGDLFSSLSIVLDKPFLVGDFIIVGDEMGVVQHIGLKTTRVRSLSGEQLVFSNSDLLESRVRNFGRMAERRVVFTIDATYGSPVEAVERLPGALRAMVESIPGTRFDRAHFARFTDSALQFEVVYFVLSPDFLEYMDIQQRINLLILRHFAAEGLAFAFPSRTIYSAAVAEAGVEAGRR